MKCSGAMINQNAEETLWWKCVGNEQIIRLWCISNKLMENTSYDAEQSLGLHNTSQTPEE